MASTFTGARAATGSKLGQMASLGLLLAFQLQSVRAADTSAELTAMSVAQLKEDANEKYFADDSASARKAIEALLSRSECQLKHLDHECLEFFMNLAVCQIQQKEYQPAKKLLKKLLNYASREESSNSNGGMDEPDCLFFLAECNYQMGEYKKAEPLYRESLALYRKLLDPLSLDLTPSLTGLAGCLARKSQYAEALPLLEELVRIDVKNNGPDSLKTGWSLMAYSDTLKHLGRVDEAAALFEKAVYAFREANMERMIDDLKKKNNTAVVDPSLRTRLRSLVFGGADQAERASGGKAFSNLIAGLEDAKTPPQRPLDFYNWRLKATRVVDAPGLVTMNADKPMKALVMCVHGLGLHHGTYKQFADAMAERGFGVVAFDVRGFGTYKDMKGYDKVDLNNCVTDLAGILKLWRRDYPKLSIFLLGESMGGALALHVAAANTSLIDGLVSSVPSGSRFGSTKTDVKVVFRLLTNKNKPYDIGKSVVAKATQDKDLRQSWQDDPEARLKLSAVELLQFQRFMNQNTKTAEQLRKLPVIIFQGYGDKLVRPDGTLALYNSIKSEDKDLVFVGHSEHLIFEEGQFRPSVINGLSGWLSGHLKEGDK